MYLSRDRELERDTERHIQVSNKKKKEKKTAQNRLFLDNLI